MNSKQLPRPLRLASLLLFACAPLATVAHAATSGLLELSIEELSELEVTSASRRPEPLAGVASSLFVITAEDIQRSGATSIPELLRLVPGLQVARLGHRRWAISARGFNGEFANKLLVQIDGRSVYSPVHSGVDWDFQDILLADIDRIEVIRGPGASQWGANAVNGVINVITKTSGDTPGGLLSLASGNELGLVAARWGDALGEHGNYRAYGKYVRRDQAATHGGGDANDGWWQGRIGFRSDWEAPGRDRYTLQGDLYQARETVPADADVFENRARGGNLNGHWTRALGDREQISLRGYIDWAEADPLTVRERVVTLDVDFEHRFRLGDRQQIVWGLGLRHIDDRFGRDRYADGVTISFDPSSRNTQVASGFVQDTLALTDSLALTLGSKLEHNDYSGLDLQPSARLAWTPNPRHTVWAAVSRALRTPSRGESDIVAVFAGPPALRFEGNPKLEPERLLAYELGYRLSPSPRLFLDLALFHHDYDRVVGSRYRFGPGGFSGEYANGVSGDSSGLELAARWQAHPRWRLDLAYSYLDLSVRAPDLHPESETPNGAYPEQQLSLLSRLDLRRDLQLDAWLRYVDRLSGLDVPGYATLDLRLGWQAAPATTISLIGQNLTDPRHPEFTPALEVERSFYLRLDQRF